MATPALEQLQAVVQWIDEQTRGLRLPADRRSRIAHGCLDLAIEHQAGIYVLAEQPLWGPVYVLIRPLFDATVRAMWLATCATDEELDLFEADKLSRKKNFTNLVDELEAKLGHSGGVLSKLRKSSWSILSDFTHTGFKHVLRRNSESQTGPNYSAQETEQVLRLAAGLGLFAATAMADLAGNRELAATCLARAREFAATAPGKPGP
jgi:hypothetical protein